MNLTNEERQALIGMLEGEIARYERLGMSGMDKGTSCHELDQWFRMSAYRLALAALTADPVAYRWEGVESGRLCYDGIKPLGVISQPLYTRAAPPAPFVVKLPKKYGLGQVFSTEEVVEAIKEAGGSVAEDGLDGKRRAFIASLTDDTAPQQYESLADKTVAQRYKSRADEVLLPRSSKNKSQKKDPQ